MDEIEVVIFDWDETLVCGNYFFPGAIELIKNLQQKGIRVCICTARPEQGVASEIRRMLEQADISLCKQDIMSVGEDKYQNHYTHEVAGQRKAARISTFALNNHFTTDNILFVDDKPTYINAVGNVGFRTKLVPQNLIGTPNVSEYIPFYQDIESFISRVNKPFFILRTLLDKLYNVLNGIDIDPFYSPSVNEIRLSQLQREINKNNDKHLNKKSYDEYIETQYKKGLIKINDYTNLLDLSSGLEGQVLPAEPISEDTIVTMLLDIAKNNDDVWKTQGSTGLFGRKKPDGIDQIAKTNYVNLNSMIDDIKVKSSTFKYSLYTSLGVRSKMTDEFYNLILSLESVSKETQLKAINTFCDKWIPKKAMPPGNKVHLEF